MNDSPERHEREFNESLNHHDYHHIFLHGCCYHFALKLNDLYQLDLRFVPSMGGGIGHCWAKMPNGRAVDINGVMHERLIVQIYQHDYTASPLDITRERLLEELQKKGMSDDLNQRAFALAEKIITTHHRFEDVNPSSDPFTVEELE